MSHQWMNYFTQQTKDWFEKTFGTPTKVQEEAWPAIGDGKHILVSAPTGTGKTLSAFLIFIDQMMREAQAGELKDELQLIYISPLKSLAGDIRENLERPLKGLKGENEYSPITVGLRTGDTTPAQRRQMIRKPPHILITTPESLYLLLTSNSGKKIIQTAKAIIIDELHAMIDTKRGAHLMLSIARLDHLCKRYLQRIGLSATIEPLDTAARYLSSTEQSAVPNVVIAAPFMKKDIRIHVTSSLSEAPRGVKKDTVWEELSRKVWERCQESKSVIAFVEGRRFAEKLAYYINLIGGEGFARTHHGSLSKEQRLEVEDDLRSGRLRLLCATSSMELGIDVGEIDQVLQIGCPKTVSGTMQRLGRAGHNPGRESVMYMYPRTPSEGVYCGLTAQTAKEGGVEYANPPMKCLDVLAQHLVSMACGEPYTVDEVMDILSGVYTFRDISRQEVRTVLCMLAGDDEHDRDIPVRPRLLYDRIHERVEGDSYSRMLAISAGGTIPDRGMYTVKTTEGVKLGELDEEFVFETNKGEKFLLGTFAWKMVGQDKDTVIVTQAGTEGAKLPFWKGELKGRSLRTSLKFGKIFRKLNEACKEDTGEKYLMGIGLDERAARQGLDFLTRQIKATQCLPDDRTIIAEHFFDQTGAQQIMFHSMFGRQVNTPLSLLLKYETQKQLDMNIGCVDEEDGFLIYPYGTDTLPEGLLYRIQIQQADEILEALLPATPVFNMSFRYNAARALMMGVKKNGRTPLWMQRIRSADMLDHLVKLKDHPLIEETKRECLKNIWDVEGVKYVLEGIFSGAIQVKEVYTQLPSPMSIPLQRQVEVMTMYDYSPTPDGIYRTISKDLDQIRPVAPDPAVIEELSKRSKLPENSEQLHTLLMTEGDLEAGELDVPIEWLLELEKGKRACYLEPGLWIAAEHLEEYEKALEKEDEDALRHLVRRMLRYRGAQKEEQIGERYFLSGHRVRMILNSLMESGEVIRQDEYYYHAKLFERARSHTIRNLRKQIVTQPSSHFASLAISRMKISGSSREQVKHTLNLFSGNSYPVQLWENVILPARVTGYREDFLDQVLAEGSFFWKLEGSKNSVSFERYDDIDWDISLAENPDEVRREELILYRTLLKRGASFMNTMSGLIDGASPHDFLISLAQKGLICADSFIPVRQSQSRIKINKTSVRQRINARVMTLNAGRWDVVRSIKEMEPEEKINRAFDRMIILCRETVAMCDLSWAEALEILKIWEYTGRARRGYFVEGMSGAQFIREKDFASAILALDKPEGELLWICGADPSYLWGKVFPHLPGREVMSIPGNYVALYKGIPVMSVLKQGKKIEIYDQSMAEEALVMFASEYKKKKIFASVRRLIVKEYPEERKEYLSMAGFMKEMQDYVLYR